MNSITSLASLSTLGIFFLVGNGCAVDSASEESMSTDDVQLQLDQGEVDDIDEVASTVLDDATEGTDGTKSGLASKGELQLLDVTHAIAEGEVDPSADPAQQAEKARKNAGLFFKPAGCITSSVEDNVVTHVFKDCIGPNELDRITGTVKATWTRGANSIQVVREPDGFRGFREFKIGGSNIERKVTVVFSKDGAVYKKSRVVSLLGSTLFGRQFSRDASWNLSYDGSSKCWSRDGSSNSEIITSGTGRRSSFTTEVKNVLVCGLARCPVAGSISVAQTNSKDDKTKSRTLLVEFLGDRKQRTTFTNAKGETKTVERGMFCRG